MLLLRFRGELGRAVPLWNAYSLVIEPFLHKTKKAPSRGSPSWLQFSFKLSAYADDVVIFVKNQD